jgi:hypothetical protein
MAVWVTELLLSLCCRYVVGTLLPPKFTEPLAAEIAQANMGWSEAIFPVGRVVTKNVYIKNIYLLCNFLQISCTVLECHRSAFICRYHDIGAGSRSAVWVSSLVYPGCRSLIVLGFVPHMLSVFAFEGIERELKPVRIPED